MFSYFVLNLKDWVIISSTSLYQTRAEVEQIIKEKYPGIVYSESNKYYTNHSGLYVYILEYMVTMKVYAVNNDLNNLLLVDGDWVVNGAFRVRLRASRKTLVCPHTNLIAYYVMEAPIKHSDYNVVLNKVTELLKEQGKL